MIVVEGPDGSGKSTVVRRLNRDLQLPVADRVVSAQTQAMVDLAQWTEANVEEGFQDVIFDRHRLISEPIYGPVLRKLQDPHFLDPEWLSKMMERFYQASPILIYCLPPLSVVRSNVSNPDTDNSRVASNIDAIYSGYASRIALDSLRGVIWLYNYTATPYAALLNWIHTELEVRRDRARNEPLLDGRTAVEAE